MALTHRTDTLKSGFRAEGGGICGKCTWLSQMLQLLGGEGREAAWGPCQTPRGTPSRCAPLVWSWTQGPRHRHLCESAPPKAQQEGCLGSPHLDFCSEESEGSSPPAGPA